MKDERLKEWKMNVRLLARSNKMFIYHTRLTQSFLAMRRIKTAHIESRPQKYLGNEIGSH